MVAMPTGSSIDAPPRRRRVGASSVRDTATMSDAGWSVQVTFDCADAHVLADWWAETLRWEVEPQDESFIRSMIEQGYATEDDTTTHRGSLVWRGAAAVGPRPDGPGPDGPRLLFMEVPEPKTVKNRVHLDLRPPPGSDLESLRREVEARGATRVGSGRQGPHSWIVYTDPESNEFCL